MSTAVVQLPGRLRSWPFFLSAWLVSYLGPHLLAAVAEVPVLTTEFPAVFELGSWIIWLGLLPPLYAWAQWLLMRRCLSTAIPWAVAVFAGTLLARMGSAAIGNIEPHMVFGWRPALDIVVALMPVLGATFATVAVTMLPVGLLWGLATSIPQAFVLPGSRLARITWIAVMIPTEYASTVLGEGVYQAIRPDVDSPIAAAGVWGQLIASSFAPRTCAWLLTATVSGLLMHAILRRRVGSMSDSLYARFD